MVFTITGAKAQTSKNDSLMKLEYGYYMASGDTAKNAFLYKKIKLHMRAGNTDSIAMREFKRIRPSLLSDPQQKKEILWNGAIVSYLHNEFNYAQNFMNGYEQLTGDTSVPFRLLNVLIHKYNDSTLVNRNIHLLLKTDSSFACLSCFAELSRYKRKHHDLSILSSAIVPGSGTMANGRVIKGMVSLALTAGSVYGVVRLAEAGLYLNAALWGSGLGLKFYVGNLNLTDKTFYEKENKHRQKMATACEENLKKLLQKYPIYLLD